MILNETITIALLAPIMLVYLVMSAFNKKYINPKYFISIHPDKGLWQQGPFWLSITYPLIAFLTFGIPVWGQFEPSITADGYANFLKISTLPLGLLALAIPFTAITSRFHSAQQTVTQITIAQTKNNLDAFYSHRKEFFDYFDRTDEVFVLGIMKANYSVNPRLHYRLFTGAPEHGAPAPNTDLLREIEAKINLARTRLDEVVRDVTPELTFRYYIEAADAIYWIAKTLGLREIKYELGQRSIWLQPINPEDTNQYMSLGQSTSEAIAAFRYAKSYLLVILHFIGDTESIDRLYEREIHHIDVDTSYKNINKEGLTIERRIISGAYLIEKYFSGTPH